MKVNKLTFRGFRNLTDCELNTKAKQIILTGENGQGKTNLLELVYILCYGSSFRTQNLKDCIKYSENQFLLKCEFTDSENLSREIEIVFSQTGKSIKLDEKEIHDRKELIYCLPCIVFSHDDIEFVRGEPENRRRFFDQTMTMYDSQFFDLLRKYKYILRQRNVAIKEKQTEILSVLDEKLAEYGLLLMKERSAVCSSFDAIFPDIYRAVSLDDKNIKITYRPSWNPNFSLEDVKKYLSEQRETDLKMGTSTSGPHRDRFIISDQNGLFVNGASTGQMRLASLVFRSAQAAFYRQKTGIDPIFLIDDVLLELDPQKRARYLTYLGHYNQAFFTFLPDEKYFSSYGLDCTMYNVEKGEFLASSK